MTAPARRRKVSGGARSGCLPGVLARGCPPGAARWEHPPRPAPRTLILPGGRRRLGGGRGHPAPSLALGSWLWVTQTTVPGNQGRRGPEPEPCPRIVPLPFGWPCVFVGAIGVERSLHRGGEGGGLGARRRHEHRKEAGSIRGGAGRRSPLRRPAVESARKLLSAARWTNFLRVLGLPFLLPSGRQCRAWVGGGRRREARDPVRPPPPRARPPAPPPRPRSLRKLRP